MKKKQNLLTYILLVLVIISLLINVVLIFKLSEIKENQKKLDNKNEFWIKMFNNNFEKLKNNVCVGDEFTRTDVEGMLCCVEGPYFCWKN